MILNNLKNYLKNAALLQADGIHYSLVNTSSPLKLYPLMNSNGEQITNFYTRNKYNTAVYAPFDNNTSLIKAPDQTGKGARSTNELYIGFGTGTTPVTADDFKLESQINISTIALVSSESSISNVITISEDKTKATRVATVVAALKNNGDSDIEINEIGLFQSFNYVTGYLTMLHREVFDSPVTIGAGAIATFTLKFEFSHSIV